jgi:hypothetical protein
MSDEWAWDESHILYRSQSRNEGDKRLNRFTRLWDGSLAIECGEQSDHKQYVLGNKADQFFASAANLALLPWGPGDGYHLWWSPRDVVRHRKASFIAPEDFELAGQEEVLGKRCHVLQSRAGLVREYVGVADGRLYRREILLSHEGEARQLAICQKIVGPSIKSLNAWWDWLKILKPQDRSQAYRAFQEAQFETARVYLSQTFEDYREVAPGCWLSFRQRMDTYETDVPKSFLGRHAEQTITDVTVNQPLPQDLFHFEFADGVPVATDWRYDPPIHYTYRKDQTEAQRAALCAELHAVGATIRKEWKDREAVIEGRKGEAPPPLPATGWINGGPMSWDQLRGKVVVLHFWDVHCRPSINELPLVALWHKRAAEEGAVIIGIHPPTDDLAAVRKELADVGADYCVLVDSPATKSGGVGLLHDWFGNSWWPNTVLVDKAGRVAGHGQLLGGDIIEQVNCLASDSTIVMVRSN